MNIKDYFQPILKWWWMLAVACVLASVSSYIITKRQPPIYQAHTTLMVGQTINDPNPAQTQFYLEQQLAQIYANMASRELVQTETKKALGLTWLPEYHVVAIPNSQLVDILVTDTNPARAQAVASELGRQLISRSPTVGQTDDKGRQDFIRNQLDALQKQIKDTQAEIDRLQAQIGTLNSARQISDTQGQISALGSKMTVLQANYATLLGNSKQGAPNSLSVIEPAELPTAPVGPNWKLAVIMSALIGMGLAALGAYAIEFFDPTFRNLNEVNKTLEQPVLGQIASIPKQSLPFFYVSKYPLSPIADAFRFLKNSVETLGIGETTKVLQIVSSETGEGKTTISMGLAVTFAKAGKRVTLVDADMRKSSLTKYLEMEDCDGLGEVLLGEINLTSALQGHEIDNLHILPAGKEMDHPADMLDSVEMDDVLIKLHETSDIIIIDSPPAFIADTFALARKTGFVLYVIRINRSRREQAKSFIAQMENNGVDVIGSVLNGMPIGSTYYGKRYRQYSSYYDAANKAALSHAVVSNNGSRKKKEPILHVGRRDEDD